MANNRYYLYCPCGESFFVGKSMGAGIYHTTKAADQIIQEMYAWMWEHLMYCKRACPPNDCLGPEWQEGEIFKVLTEYDTRINPKRKVTPADARKSV